MNSNDINNFNSHIDTSNDKKIDNRIISTKEKINNIDNRLDVAKRKIKNLQNMQENVNSIAKSMNRCIDLLSKSIKGPTVNNKFEDMRSTNKIFYAKTTASIEEETMGIRKTINELYKEKDELLKENRQKYNQEQIQKEEANKENTTNEKEINNQEGIKKE